MTAFVTVTKRQAAEAQIETAIKLYFEHRDFISAYTLASAALGILGGIWKKEKQQHLERRAKAGRTQRSNLSDEWGARLDPSIKVSDGFFWLTRHQNFFKHADKDHDKTIDFRDAEQAAMQIWIAINDYTLIYDEATAAMSTFFSWFAVQHPEFLGESNPLRPVLEQAGFDRTKYTAREMASVGLSTLLTQCPNLFQTSRDD
jgi:hypothetical protein